MLQLIAWVAVCVVIAVLGRRRPVELVALTLAFAVLVPYVASYRFTGQLSGPVAFAAPTWLFLAIFGVALLRDPRAFGEAMTRRFGLYVVVGLVVVAAVFETERSPAAHGLVVVVNEMLGPFLAFWTVSAAAYRRPGGSNVLRRTIVVLGVAEGAYAILQAIAGRILLFDGAFHREYWYVPGYHRWMGTTDSTLVLSLLLAATIPMLKTLRSAPVQYASVLVLLGGIFVTQSRTGLIAGVAAAIYLVFASRGSGLRRAVSSSSLVVGLLAIVATGLSAGVADRLANDNGSALARDTAYSYYFAHLGDFFFAGSGAGTSYTVAQHAHQASNSFESALVMYSVDFGVVLTVLYLGALVRLAARHLSTDGCGAALAALIVLVLCQTFSSLEISAVVGPLLFLLLAITVDERDTRRSGGVSASEPVSVPFRSEPVSMPSPQRPNSTPTARPSPAPH